MISAGYYVIDLSEYGVQSTSGSTYTFTYKVKTLCHNYGIDYTTLSVDDFVYGFRWNQGLSIGPFPVSNPSFSVGTATATPSYDASTGIFKLSGISATVYINSSDGPVGGHATSFSAEQMLCLLVPRSVVVD